MDKHPAGPRDCTVLTRQAEHRSSWLWDGPPTGQAWPGVLTCRHRFSCMPKAGLDPRVAGYITDAGLGGLFHVPNIELDHALITALVERWRPETHSFHLPHGEMTITLQDIEVIMGVPVVGLPVVGKTNMEWGNLCHELLGHKPPDKEPHANENTAMLCGARLKLSWLKSMFNDPLPADATDLRVQQYARYYILEMLSGMLFMDKSGERISVMYLQFLNPISNGKKYSWGSAALSWLYRHLCKASETTAKQIGGALLLVQIWAYARFPHICPVMRHPHQALPPGPLAVRWKVSTCTTEHATHVLSAYRMSLASLRPNQILWEPYKSMIGSLPSYCTAGQHIWRSTVPLLHFWVVEGHHPERVLR